MVKTISITLFMTLLLLTANAQDEFTGYKNILRAQGTFSAGYNMPFKSMNYFLHGDLEYHPDEKISIRSDVYYFLNSNTPNDLIEPFKFQHSLFTGIQYHFLKGRFDWYAGFQPGLMLGQRQYSQITEAEIAIVKDLEPQKTVAMLFSLNTGINYYASKFFHFFFHTRYNIGWFSDNYSTASLNEIRFSFGLGFYLKTKKDK